MLLELDKYETIGHKGLSGFWASSSKIEEFTKAFEFTDETGNSSTEPIIEEIYKEILKLRKERMEGNTMRWSQMLIPTLKDAPSDAEIISHQLMIRAGMMRKLGAGVYNYLPLGWRVIKKIQDIIREELDKIGCQELLMPVLSPSELWKESGRWDVYGDEMMRLTDRHKREFALGPTHEEVITDIARGEIKSYKQLPMCLYQIQTKFRDEIRPRFGVMRSREFIMKDAYSFHTSQECLDNMYNKMYEAYSNIFERCGLQFRPVEADSGAIGGSDTHEFMVLAENGESEVLICKCGYAATDEKAESKKDFGYLPEAMKDMEKVETPDKKTIEEVAAFLNSKEENCAKIMFYKYGKENNKRFVAVLIRGDRELNEAKLRTFLKVDMIEMATEEEILALKGIAGYSGPIGLDEKIKVFADFSLQGKTNLVIGANEENYHYINANFDRDFQIAKYIDVLQVRKDDPCPICDGGILESYRGIEAGQVFKLGDKYSKSMNATYLDENGKTRNYIMGCYGIGVTRTVAAAIEQNYDENGIIWPLSIAPFHVTVTALNPANEEVSAISEKLYAEFMQEKIEVIYDDRNLRAGFKFKDAELVGIPYRVVVSEKLIADGKVEIKERKSGDTEIIDINDAIKYVSEKIKANL